MMRFSAQFSCYFHAFILEYTNRKLWKVKLLWQVQKAQEVKGRRGSE